MYDSFRNFDKILTKTFRARTTIRSYNGISGIKIRTQAQKNNHELRSQQKRHTSTADGKRMVSNVEISMKSNQFYIIVRTSRAVVSCEYCISCFYAKRQLIVDLNYRASNHLNGKALFYMFILGSDGIYDEKI